MYTMTYLANVQPIEIEMLCVKYFVCYNSKIKHFTQRKIRGDNKATLRDVTV